MIALNRDEVIKSWGPYVRDVANRMRLNDFEIGLGVDTCSEDSNAEIESFATKKLSRIYLSDNFLGECPEEQRRIVVHELVHAHLHVVDGMIRKLLRTSEYELVWIPLEVAVEDFARIIAPTMPLPGESPEASTIPLESGETVSL